MKCSLREVFLFVVLVAVGCGWFASELRWRAYAAKSEMRFRYLDMLSMHLEQALLLYGHTVARQGDGTNEFAVPLVDGKEVDGLAEFGSWAKNAVSSVSPE